MCFCDFLDTIPFSWSKIFKLTSYLELFEVLVWPIIIMCPNELTIDFLLKTCASEYMQITVPFCPQLQPDSLFFTWWIATLAIRNIIGVGITCPVILITGRGSLCPFSYICIFVRPDGQPCVEAQHYTTIVPDSLFLPDGLQTLLDLMDSHVWRLKSLDW